MISGEYGMYVGSTPLTGAHDAFQFIIAGNKTVVTNRYYYDRCIDKWDVLVFNYPEGGYQTEEILNSGSPVGSVALSRRRKAVLPRCGFRKTRRDSSGLAGTRKAVQERTVGYSTGVEPASSTSSG
jgi:hypothetical protein